MKLWYDLDEENNVIGPFSIEEIAERGRQFEDCEWRRVDQTAIRPGTTVSTVFLQLDHNFNDAGPPVVFETMVFSNDESIDQWMERYTTWDEAQEGHNKVVKQLMEGAPLDE